MSQAIGATCRGADGQTGALLLLCGVTLARARFFETLAPDLCKAIGIFAQQLTTLQDNRWSRATIERQLADCLLYTSRCV